MAGKRVKVILNPTADRGRAWRLQSEIVDLARPFGGADIIMTDEPGHATSLARDAAAAGYRVVAAAGGDGTAHEVVNGLLQEGRATADLGLIPLGTGNDLAWGLGLLSQPDVAVRRLFEGTPRRIDVGRIEDENGRFRYFANGLGIGFDALIAIESQRIQRLQGFILYLTAALKTILFQYYAPSFEIRFDNEPASQHVLLLAIGNGPRAGGGFLLTPAAQVDDGQLDSCTVRPVSRPYMLRMLLKVMKGTHVNLPPVTMRRNRAIFIQSTLPLPIHSDGEIFAFLEDNVHWVKVTAQPGAVRVMS